MKSIKTERAPQAIGPYSQAVVAGNLIFLSGQLPIIPETGELVEEGIESQTRRVILNIAEVLKAAGCQLTDVAKTTVFLRNMNDFEKMNLVYASFFKHRPARSAVEVSRLPKGAGLEIECIAVMPGE